MDVQWIPESIFEEALALYEKALPGKGSIPERLAYYHQHYRLPAEKARLLPELMQRAVWETRTEQAGKFKKAFDRADNVL